MTNRSLHSRNPRRYRIDVEMAWTHRRKQLATNPGVMTLSLPHMPRLFAVSSVLVTLLLSLSVSGCSRAAADAPVVRPGIEVFATNPPEVVRGKRVGLMTNHSAFDRHRVSTIDVIHRMEEVELVALFAPEHGIRATESGYLASETDSATGLPIHSLYGQNTRKPTPEMMEGIEALIFDIQDVGARQYTYISTMALGMQAAREAGIPFVVLDRPNPIGGEIVEGNVLDTAHTSFVGMYPIASRHGMTVGELAMMFNDAFGIGADLTVLRAEGWKRSMWFDETELPWRPPSPNLRTLEAAIHYPGTVFFEPNNLSEGRGSDRPFEQTGAPWLDAVEVAERMNAMNLPGVEFEAIEYAVDPEATRRRYAGETIPGVRLILRDRMTYRPVESSLRLLGVIQEVHPNVLEWTDYLTLLAGTESLRSALVNGELDAWLDEAEQQAEAFRSFREPYLIYD
jgi:uncharacterized protein YbbC (DUF1343 family)